MGELLRFPDRSSGAAEGAGDAPAPSRPARSRPAEQALEDLDRLAGPEARARAAEARWTVPGVDADEPVPVEPPTRAAKRAQNVAMAALTRHDASEGEIRAKLVAKGLDEADVAAELERLREVGLIDDAAFAERLIDRLRERKGLGDSAIRSTLRGRLVAPAVVDAVLAERVEDEDDAAVRLQEVADDRARRLGSLSHEVAERRLTAYLMRKGYSGSAVRTAVRTALEGTAER